MEIKILGFKLGLDNRSMRTSIESENFQITLVWNKNKKLVALKSVFLFFLHRPPFFKAITELSNVSKAAHSKQKKTKKQFN